MSAESTKVRKITPESALKKRFINEIFVPRGVYWVRVDQGASGKPGDPDLVICYKGRFIGIEAKTYSNGLRPMQKRRMEEILSAGGRFVMARCNKDVEDILDEIDLEEKGVIFNDKED